MVVLVDRAFLKDFNTVVDPLWWTACPSGVRFTMTTPTYLILLVVIAGGIGHSVTSDVGTGRVSRSGPRHRSTGRPGSVFTFGGSCFVVGRRYLCSLHVRSTPHKHRRLLVQRDILTILNDNTPIAILK